MHLLRCAGAGKHQLLESFRNKIVFTYQNSEKIYTFKRENLSMTCETFGQKVQSPFKEKKDWLAKGYKPEDMAQDVKVIMPPLDLFAKTK